MLTGLLLGLGVALALEGVAYALNPDGMKGLMARVLETSSDQLRMAGLVALILGVAIVALVTRQPVI